MRLLSRALAYLVIGGFCVGVAPPLAAQESGVPAASPAPDAETSVEVLRMRGTSGWRNYVWTLDRERLQLVVRDLEEARRRTGGEADFTQVFLIAYGSLILGRDDVGRRAADEARTSAPTYPGLLLLDAFAATLDGDSDAAIERLDRFVEIVEAAQGDAEFRFLGRLHRGVQLFESGQHDRAIQDLEVALAIARENDRKPPNELVLRLALAHQRVQQFAAAERLVRGMLVEDPGNPYLYYNLGLLFGTQNNFVEARRWYLAATRRKRDYADPHVKLAFLAWKESSHDAAQLAEMRTHLEAYRDLIGKRASDDLLADADTGFGTYWFAIAEQRAVAGHDALALVAYKRARAHFLKALEYNPACVRALSNLVKIGFQIGHPETETAPFKERLDAIDEDGRKGPKAYRSTFC